MQLALLTHAKLLDLMPPEKRGSELLAAVQTVATSLRSMDEIEGVTSSRTGLPCSAHGLRLLGSLFYLFRWHSL